MQSIWNKLEKSSKTGQDKVQDTIYNLSIRCRYKIYVRRYNSDRIIKPTAAEKQSNTVASIMMTSGQLSALDNNTFAKITKLKRQAKSAHIEGVHAQIIKTVVWGDH